MTTSHSTKPQSAGQVAGYSHLTKLQKAQQVIGYPVGGRRAGDEGQCNEPKNSSTSHRDHRVHREINRFTRIMDSPKWYNGLLLQPFVFANWAKIRLSLLTSLPL
jgi:hypothetical protein